ncbi:MAG: response regulator transcription factor [Flavobacteriales bacterium]|nr:response regulator transcription factor [Flavobacteriales bacterium]
MNILVVEDHTMFLEYIVSVLKNRENVHNILTASNGKDAFGLLHENKIDLLMTDLNLPKVNGIQLIERTRKYYPRIKIVVLTQYKNSGLSRKLKNLGVDGFLTKNASQEELNELLSVVISGDSLFTSQLTNEDHLESITEEEQLLSDSFQKISQLSKRETEVMHILLENKTNKEISDQLKIGVETVITHRKNIYRKLGVNNVLDLYKLISDLE